MGLIGSGIAVSSIGGTRAFAGITASTPAPNADGLSEPDGSLWTTTDQWTSIAGLANPVIGWAARPGGGAWEVNARGGVFARGGAPFYGSLVGHQLPSPVVAIAATPTGAGYWLVTAAGGVFTFGDATFAGAATSYGPTSSIVGMAPTASGAGYWLVTTAGGVFNFGDAGFHGSMAGKGLSNPVVGIAATGTGDGYVLASRRGGVYNFGDATFDGSDAGQSSLPTVSVATDRAGYDLVRIDGLVTKFQPGAPATTTTISMPKIEVVAGENALDPPPAPISHEAQVRAKVVAIATSELGKPYVYGAAGPGAFDCSGRTQDVYGQAGVSLPHTAAGQLESTPNVTAAQLQPGDLVYFYAGITHVGIYIGAGQMIDAPHTGTVVRVDSMQYYGPLMGASDPAA